MQLLTLPESFHLLFFVGLMFVLSEAAGNIAGRLRLPRMLGYITMGVLCGPYLLGWFDARLVEQDLEFFRNFALSVIAFSIGGSLQMADLHRLRASLAWISLFQTTFASLLTFLALWWLLSVGLPGPSSHVLVAAIVLGAVSCATAPAPVLSLIDEYKAKGDFRAALLGIVALDDVIAIVFYSVAIAWAGSLLTSTDISWVDGLGETSLVLLAEIALGLVAGLIVAKSLFYFSEYRTMLGALLGTLMTLCGLCLSVGLSPLLTNMMLGFMVANLARHELADEAMDIIHTIQQPVFAVFFFMAGASLNIHLGLTAIALALALTMARFAGKYGGTVLGGRIAGTEPMLTNNLGLALLPAGGVMIGLTMNARDSFGPQLDEFGELIVTIVIGATLINSLMTPFLVRYAIERDKRGRP